MPKPIDTPPIYQNPFMAPNDFSGIHLNAYMTDTGAVKGPASALQQTLQQKPMTPPGIAATIAFNAQGQLLTIRIGSPKTLGGAPHILLIDPTTLNIVTMVELPQRASSGGQISFAGGYFYLDQKSNVVCVTADQKIQIYSTNNNKLAQLQSYNLSSLINDPSDILNSVLPDSLGNIWYITQKGVVGYVNTSGKPSPVVRLNEPISKSFASDANAGVYVLTDYALYCYRSGTQGPVRSWRTSYDRGSTQKPGQNQQGSGTTPTCFDDFEGNRFVTITDNADPQMHVNVYSRDTGILVAQQEVFKAQGSDNCCENSLIAVNHSIIVENNYGNLHIDSTAGPLTTTPGMNRVDFDPTTGKSTVVWENNKIAVPSVVSQLSTGDGMIYTYAKDIDGWYWAALDFETGELVTNSPYIRFIEPEEASNNWYAGLTVGPTGAAYLSVFGGLTVWKPI